MAILPHILSRSTDLDLGAQLARLPKAALQKVARFWKLAEYAGFGREHLANVLAQAMTSESVVKQVMDDLSPDDRAVLEAYRRYGGTVNGAVIRLDLLSRGLLEIVKKPERYGYAPTLWKRQPVKFFVERGVLITANDSKELHQFWGHGQETRYPFPICVVSPGLNMQLSPAGPPGWKLPAVTAVPLNDVPRTPAEIVLDLSQMLAFVAASGPLKLNQSGELSRSAQSKLAKAVPIHQNPDFPLPVAEAFYFELLRGMGCLLVKNGLAHVGVQAAERFGRPAAFQAHDWIRAWLWCSHWTDGVGLAGALAWDRWREHEPPLWSSRQVLVWALASLAHRGEIWFDLAQFIEKICDDLGHNQSVGFNTWGGYSWDPKLPATRDKEKQQGEARERAYWLSSQGVWYANALMVTLVEVGMVERGRREDNGGGFCFRLTPLGRAVFGAPEVEMPVEQTRPFLLVQPNFDVVVYVNEASTGAAGTLGQLLEAPKSNAGPVRTYRLTHNSVYRALESGMNPEQIIDTLKRNSQRELPANVLQSLAGWVARRESLVVQSDLTLLAFTEPAARDAYVAATQGKAVGEFFAVLPASAKLKPAQREGKLALDHTGLLRRTLEVDEYGRIQNREAYDMVQESRLRRFAQRSETGWQLSAGSVRAAAARNHKADLLSRWLNNHMAQPMPRLIEYALFAWTNKTPTLAMARTVLLHVANKDFYDVIARSPRLRPFIAGSPGPGWLAVPADAAKQLTETLEELGFAFVSTLTLPRIPADAD
jgi:hypothetical protein